MRKKAMVWGASGGIGKALTAELVRQDWSVVAVSRSPEKLVDLTDYNYEADVTNGHEIRNVMMAAAQEFDDIQLWVYAVGDILSERVQDMAAEAWQRVMSANLFGAYFTTFHSLPLLAENAHLFYLGAVSERLRLPGLSAYAAAKSGLEAFAETLRKEQRKKRVTVVRPGAVKTPLWDKVSLRLPSDAADPKEVARKILDAYSSEHSGHLDLVHA